MILFLVWIGAPNGYPRRPGRFLGQFRSGAIVCRHPVASVCGGHGGCRAGWANVGDLLSRSTRVKMSATMPSPRSKCLAGIPTVVYGFFAALTVAPFLRDLGSSFGLTVSSESALAAGGVMGIMIIPFISSLADDVITAVPQSMRDGSLAMGATQVRD